MTPESSKKRGIGFYVRIIISILLIAYVFQKAGIRQLWQTIQETRIEYLLLSLAITPLLIFISAWKWQVILKALTIRVSLLKCFWLYVVGYFFNTVLPTNVGGDIVRAYAIGKANGKRAEAFSSVFVERFTGLSVLLLMALVAFALAMRQLSSRFLVIALIVATVGYFTLLFLILYPPFLQGCLNLKFAKPIFPLLRKLLKFQTATLSIKNNLQTFVFAMVNSFVFYIIAVLNVYVSSLAFNSPITFSAALIITPIVMIVTMLPISIGGIGLAEGAYYFTFVRMGLTGAAGLSVALLLRAKALFAGVIGGLYYSTLGIDMKRDIMGQDPHAFSVSNDVHGNVNYFSGFEDVLRQKKSPLKKYQDIQIGNYNIFSLIKVECITFLFGYIPGISGYFFRKLFYPRLFKRVGKGTHFGRSITLQHSSKISIGMNCVIDEYCKLSAQGDDDSEIILGNEVLLGRGSFIGTRDGKVSVGDFSNIGSGCRLGTTTQISLGKYVLLAANCYIGGAQHTFDRTDIPIMRQGYESRGGVTIEDDVWLGTDVKVLDGVTIGTGSVIGAGSVVTHDIPPFSLAMGIPARVHASRKQGIKE